MIEDNDGTRTHSEIPIDTASAAASPLPSYLERISRFPAIRDRNDIEVIEATPWASLELPDSTLELIQISARRRPDATALRFVMDATTQQQGQRYTYAEFLARVVQAANAFHRLGVDSDDVVSFLLPSLPQTHFTLWGGEAAGVVNPINPMLEPEHIAGIMNARTTKVSNNRPSPIVVPTWAITRRSLTTMEAIVRANTTPASVTTLPVPPIERMMPVLIPAPISSLNRDTSSRL